MKKITLAFALSMFAVATTTTIPLHAEDFSAPGAGRSGEGRIQEARLRLKKFCCHIHFVNGKKKNITVSSMAAASVSCQAWSPTVDAIASFNVTSGAC